MEANRILSLIIIMIIITTVFWLLFFEMNIYVGLIIMGLALIASILDIEKKGEGKIENKKR